MKLNEPNVLTCSLLESFHWLSLAN